MFLKRKLMIIIIISIIMAKIKATKGRIYESKHKKQQELNKLNFYGLQTRHHNHYLHKKHQKCNLERSYYRQAHVKKSSRYPTLDKIVHRLDNFDKIKITTTNPLDHWNATTSSPTTAPDKSAFYVYFTVAPKKPTTITTTTTTTTTITTTKDGDHDHDHDHHHDHNRGHGPKRHPQHTWPKEDFAITLNGDHNYHHTTYDALSNGSNKDFMQDHTTSSPWENEQHDINSQFEGSTKSTSQGLPVSSTLPPHAPTNSGDARKDPNLEKVPPWSIGQLVPRPTDVENKKKKTTPMPYVAAHAHYDQVLRMGDCHIPKEKVIKVHEVHPDPSKSYSPSCTILHQCGDDTGCCRDLKQVCKPKNTTKVELYFFTTTVGKPQTVEKLHFVNHTECECQKRTEEPLPRDSEFQRNHLKKHGHGPSSEAKRKANTCVCPTRYSARFLPNESCICDCFDKQEECLVLKKGKVHFSYRDKLCIQSGDCLVPSCEFGSYIRQFGRCPNKNEKYHYIWSGILSYRDLIT